MCQIYMVDIMCTFCNHRLISWMPVGFFYGDLIHNCVQQYPAVFQKVGSLSGYLVCELEYNIQPDVTK